ncbi:MAG: DEAD/DEAH box helicase [Bacteroidaceae bacterium]
MKFTELKLDDAVLDALEIMRFDECTPVQEHTIPPLLEGKDLIGVAQTGTGKTAAYILPLLNNLLNDGHPDDAINCIIMAPTRELAQQIDQQMEGFSYYVPFSSVPVYGGNDGARFAQERRGLTLGADVVIATPGRLLAHIALGYVDLSKISYFILDEADRMLDMGFYDDIMQVVKLMPDTRQTILFSATMPDNIQKLSKNILHNPVEVKLAVSKPAEKIMQSCYICYEKQKLGIIGQLFKEQPPERVIIFSSSKLKVKEVTKSLLQMNLSVGEMHSDLDQSQRDEVMHGFKNGRIQILVATDIVSRGIDIDDISLVVNYDVPHDSEDYVHRIGRTARADRDGVAITFVCEKEQGKWRQIEKFLEKEIYKIPIPAELGEAPAYNPNSRGEGRGRRDGRSSGGREARSSSENRRKGNGENRNNDRRKNRPISNSGAEEKSAEVTNAEQLPSVEGNQTQRVRKEGEPVSNENRRSSNNRRPQRERRNSNSNQSTQRRSEDHPSGEEKERVEQAPRENRPPREGRPPRERREPRAPRKEGEELRNEYRKPRNSGGERPQRTRADQQLSKIEARTPVSVSSTSQQDEKKGLVLGLKKIGAKIKNLLPKK